MVVLGIGIGSFYPTATTAGVTSVDESQTSLAGGIVYMFQIAGGSIGLGLTTTVFSAQDSLRRRHPGRLPARRGALAGRLPDRALLRRRPPAAARRERAEPQPSGCRTALLVDVVVAGAADAACRRRSRRAARRCPGRRSARRCRRRRRAGRRRRRRSSRSLPSPPISLSGPLPPTRMSSPGAAAHRHRHRDVLATVDLVVAAAGVDFEAGDRAAPGRPARSGCRRGVRRPCRRLRAARPSRSRSRGRPGVSQMRIVFASSPPARSTV